MSTAQLIRFLIASALSVAWLYLTYTLARDTGVPTYSVVLVSGSIATAALMFRQQWALNLYYVTLALSVGAWLHSIYVSIVYYGVVFSTFLAGFFAVMLSAIPSLCGLASVIAAHVFLSSLGRSES